MVPELPKRRFDGEEVLWITGWTEGALRSRMFLGAIAPVGGYHIVNHHLARIEEIQFTAHEIAATCEWDDAVVADLWLCAENGKEGLPRSSSLPNRLITGAECLRVLEYAESALRDAMDEGKITPVGGYGPFGRFTNMDEIQFTAREIAAACAWDEGAITDLWAISGETRPVVTPETDGQQDETPEMCVARMRQERADEVKILRHLRQARGLGSKACGKLLFPDINPEAAKSKVRRMRQEHEID